MGKSSKKEKSSSVEKVSVEKEGKKERKERKVEALSVEERLLSLEKEVCSLKSQLALYEGQDVLRRFRHHVMYDLVKLQGLKVPPRMNTKKRTNFPYLLKALEGSEALLSEEWKVALKGLSELEQKARPFPLGFWDNTDNSSIRTEDIDAYVSKLPEELQAPLKAMCQCCLECTPPCARGNGNRAGKAAQLEAPGANTPAAAAEEEEE